MLCVLPTEVRPVAPAITDTYTNTMPWEIKLVQQVIHCTHLEGPVPDHVHATQLAVQLAMAVIVNTHTVNRQDHMQSSPGRARSRSYARSQGASTAWRHR